ncbi:hypothetical protein [Parabacteroides timonensis]|uniref:hypothetical protein n=1 Tax=Parabacteroides timonensis TaxID=1871013 RepID=UPI00094EDEBD|nr:hypothetical protein [Parabacteroides timonensis]
MEALNINTENQFVRKYNNMGAHNAAKLMMRKYENLTVQFKTGKDNFPYAWLESKSMAGFKLNLNQKELTWLMGYLKEGKTEDFGTEPENVEAYEKDKDYDLQLAMFKHLVEGGKVLQFVPLFRETNGYITAYASYKKGKIIFRLKRTDDLIEYLAEKELI